MTCNQPPVVRDLDREAAIQELVSALEWYASYFEEYPKAARAAQHALGIWRQGGYGVTL